jgi:PAS domain-containing protein
MTAVDGVNIGPRVGSCGTAAYRKETVIVSNINTDPLWADYRELALAYGLQAGWSTPILSAQETVLGTFAIYSREPRSPTPQERKLLEQFAHVASVAIEHTRAQESLRRSEAKYRDLIDVSPDAVYIIDTDLTYVLANPAGAELAGCTQEELIGTPIAETFVPEERPLLPARMENPSHNLRNTGQSAGSSTSLAGEFIAHWPGSFKQYFEVCSRQEFPDALDFQCERSPSGTL